MSLPMPANEGREHRTKLVKSELKQKLCHFLDDWGEEKSVSPWLGFISSAENVIFNMRKALLFALDTCI